MGEDAKEGHEDQSTISICPIRKTEGAGWASMALSMRKEQIPCRGLTFVS